MKLHETCTTDQAAPQFDHEWQRRAFGLALALSEFRHYPWSEFQQTLIATIGEWEASPEPERGAVGVLRPLGCDAREARRPPRAADRPAAHRRQ